MGFYEYVKDILTKRAKGLSGDKLEEAIERHMNFIFYRGEPEKATDEFIEIIEREMNPGSDLEKLAKQTAESFIKLYKMRQNGERISTNEQAMTMLPIIAGFYDLCLYPIDDIALQPMWCMSFIDIYLFAKDIIYWKHHCCDKNKELNNEQNNFIDVNIKPDKEKKKEILKILSQV